MYLALSENVSVEQLHPDSCGAQKNTMPRITNSELRTPFMPILVSSLIQPRPNLKT